MSQLPMAPPISSSSKRNSPIEPVEANATSSKRARLDDADAAAKSPSPAVAVEGGSSGAAAPASPDVEGDVSTDSAGTANSGTPQPAESMYPSILADMINVVLANEAYLFSEHEVALLRSYGELNYEARYLFSRLVQRKDAWIRLDKLRYSEQDCPDVRAAIAALCVAQATTSDDAAGSSQRLCLGMTDMDRDDCSALLELLTFEELKALAKLMGKHKGLGNRASAIAALLEARTQSTFGAAQSASASSNARSGSAAQLTLNFDERGKKASQLELLKQHLADLIGDCVRIAPATRNLIARLALVYYRATMPTSSSSARTTAVLAHCRRRTYPTYTYKRSTPLWASREHLIAMERALSLEATMEELLEWDGSKEALEKAKELFEGVWDEWQRHVKEAEEANPDGIDRMTYHRMRFHPGWPLTRIVYKGAYVLGRFKLHAKEEQVLRALLAQRIFRRGRRGDWYDRLALIIAMYSPDERKRKQAALEVAVRGIEDPETHLIYHDTLQRRIVRLESQLNIAFSRKHDFSYAKLATCEERTFTGTRLDTMAPPPPKHGIFGAALPAASNSKRASPSKQMRRSQSTESVVAGASQSQKDDLSGFEQRAPLRKVVRVERKGSSSAASSKLDDAGAADASPALRRTPSGNEDATLEVERKEVRASMASVWRGLDGLPCRVEDLVLQHYAEQGYTGFHDEGAALSMIFTLIMWDVLFFPIDGVFETQYQRAPLDLGEDSFSIARGPQIRERLQLIENTGGVQLVREADERERPSKTYAVGCRWDDYTTEELLEITECLGGRALAVICQMFVEEYQTAGKPDLILWRMRDKRVKFAEVKGPGDRLSDKQKVWIDVLMRAGVQTEVSLVREAKAGGKNSSGSKSPKKPETKAEEKKKEKEVIVID